MRQLRTRALAMVHALRTACSGLGAEHSHAASVLGRHFAALEGSLGLPL